MADSAHAIGDLQDDSPTGPTDWRWQLRHSLRTAAQLEAALPLSPEELEGARRAEKRGFPILITPYVLGLIDRNDPACPIRRQVVPVAREADACAGDLQDPLGEQAHEVAPDLIQRYPDRALLIATDRCAVHCRFCTRTRMVGGGGGVRDLRHLAPALAYLRDHPRVREVILSGGDVLAMSTERVVALVQQVRAIPSVETIRIATRVLAALPQRVTDELVTALRPYHPLWVMTHFNHPRELTPLSREACRRWVDAGFPVMSQTVLLRGVNDDPAVLEALFRGLVRERVRPYYLLQADPVRGTGHLRTPIERGLEVMRQLQGRVSGIALPKFVIDTPGGMGKVALAPDPVVSRGPGVTRVVTWRGVEVDCLDPS